MSLASVQIIKALEPIEEADAIVKATMVDNAWQVVVKKNEFKIGDKIGYIEIDTKVEDRSEYEFLRQRDFRVRTIKLRKTLSQGLIVALPIGNWKQGQDISKELGVTKYEKPDNNPLELYEKVRIPKSGWKKWKYILQYNYLYKWFPNLRRKLRSPFPTNLVGITDETRIQNLTKEFEKYQGKLFNVSYKLDGSSITIIHNKSFGKSKYRICSRRFELHDKKNDWYKVFEETNFKQYIDALVNYFHTNDVIVQGEAIGKFNGNHHKLDKEEIRLFNIIINGKRLLPEEFNEVVDKLQIPHCPRLGIQEILPTIEMMLKHAEAKDFLNPKVEVEGFVWRCLEDGFSFKCINNAYLLKEK